VYARRDLRDDRLVSDGWYWPSSGWDAWAHEQQVEWQQERLWAGRERALAQGLTVAALVASALCSILLWLPRSGLGRMAAWSVGFLLWWVPGLVGVSLAVGAGLAKCVVWLWRRCAGPEAVILEDASSRSGVREPPPARF
jgi:hypothetical protein